MNNVKRSAIAAVAAACTLIVAASPAAAIVGGQEATQYYNGAAHAQTVLPGIGTARCGGTLISPRWVRIAAHCVSDPTAAPTPLAVPGSSVTFRMGSLDRTSGGVTVTGKAVYLNPGWAWAANYPDLISDTALVELAHPVNLPFMRTAGLPVGVGGKVRLIGWGLTAFPPPPGTDLPVMLQQRDVTRLASAACRDGFITGGELCVSTGACFGDSGSAALRRFAGKWVTMGVASREVSDSDPCGQPTVYTDPTFLPFRLWEASTMFHPMPQPRTTATQPALDRAGVQRMNALKIFR